MKRNKNDVIAEIKTARDEARLRANAYKGLAAKKYDYWRATFVAVTYDETLTMFAREAEHNIPNMAAEATAEFEYERDNDIPEMTLAIIDGRRDALATVAEWMTNR